MSKKVSKKLKNIRSVLILISLLWVGLSAFYIALVLPNAELYTKESPEVLSRMDNECTGTYQQRYNCKNSIAIEVSNHSALLITEWIVLVIFVPAVSLVIYGFYQRKEPKPTYTSRGAYSGDGEESAPDDLSWKKAAKSHISKAKNPDEDQLL